MDSHVLALAVLATVLVLGTTRPVNLGALSLVAAFIVGTWTFNESVPEILAAFPTQIFVLLVGVTYLFSIANRNGTVDWIITFVIGLVGNRRTAAPWALFTLACAITSMGAFSPAVAAMLAPIAIKLGTRFGIHTLRMCIVVGMGCMAGSFSPIGPLGAIVNGVVENAGLPSTPLKLYLWTIVVTTLVAVSTDLTLSRIFTRNEALVPVGLGAGHAGGLGAGPAGISEAGQNSGNVIVSDHGRPTRVATLLALAAVMTGALVLGGDIGFLALTAGVLLSLFSNDVARHAVDDVSWGVILLICGVITYVGLLERQGTVQWVGDSIAGVGTPLIAAFLICLAGAVISAAASTTGILGVLVPLSVPLIATGNISAAGLTIAIAISSSLVDLSPFSTGGAIFMANAPQEERRDLYRGLLTFAGAMMIVGPVLSWALLLAPGWV